MRYALCSTLVFELQTTVRRKSHQFQQTWFSLCLRRYMVEAEGVTKFRRRRLRSARPPLDARLQWRIMEGSRPERARVGGYTTLEDVFASRSFGHASPKVPAAAAVAAKAVAATPGFAGRGVVASVAVAAATLWAVTGFNVGSGPMTRPLISAQSPAHSNSGSSNVPNFQDPQNTNTPPAGGGTSIPSGASGGGG